MDKGTMERFSIRSYQEIRAEIRTKVLGSGLLDRGTVICLESVGLRPTSVDIVIFVVLD